MAHDNHPAGLAPLTVCVFALWIAISSMSMAQEPNAEKLSTAATYITVEGTVDDALFGRITNAALTLQNIATQESRSACLILEIRTGSSRFGQVHDLARLFKSDRIPDVQTVAFIPGDLRGNNVILALSCSEIVLGRDASIGDIGRGNAVDAAEIDSLERLISLPPRNPLINPAIARSMAVPDDVLVQVRIRDAAGQERTDFISATEAEQLAEQDVEIQSSQVKEAGVVGIFSTRDARRLNIIASHFCDTRDELAAIYSIAFDELQESAPRDSVNRVNLIEVTGPIDHVLSSFVDRQIRDAVDSGSQIIIFQIDSPGGLLVESEFLANRIAELDPSIRTVAWIPEKAISGAAILALGCDEIYMRPSAQIGDAAPIEIRPGQAFERAPEKILSKLRTTMGSLAEMKGRSPALLKAMADKDLLVWAVKDPATGAVQFLSDEEIDAAANPGQKLYLVEESKKDNLLTLSGTRAHELRIALSPVSDFDEVRLRLGIPPSVSVAPAQPSWVDTTIYVLNSSFAMFLLLVFGIIFIYLELHFVNGLMGILATLCFALFFWSRFLGGTAGWLEVILFLLGLGCIALEIFIIPGFGVFGLSGGLLVVASLVMASQTFRGVLWGQSGDLRTLAGNLGTVSASVASVIITAAFLNRFLPSMPFLNAMVLIPPGQKLDDSDGEPLLDPSLTSRSEDPLGMVGQKGIAISILRPSGKARLKGELHDVVTEGGMIREGTKIEVVEVSGNRIVVRTDDGSHS